MPRKVSMEEMLEMMADGDSFVDGRPVVIEGFKMMLEQMREIADIQREASERNAQAIADAVEKITKSVQNGRVDMDRVERILTAALARPQDTPRPDYVFNVERDSSGLLSSIRATKVLN